MEKDFLRKRGTERGAESSKGGRVDSAVAAQRPLCDRSASIQQFILFESQLEEKPQNALFDPASSTAFMAVCTTGSNTKSCVVQTPKVAFGMDWNNVQQVPMHAPVSHASAILTMNCPSCKVHGTSNGHNLTVTAIKPQPFLSMATNNNSLLGAGVESFPSRKGVKPSPTSGQLTIFYAGSVNVYDDVPWDKAEALMLMASEGCKTTVNTVHTIAEAPAFPLTKASNTAAQASHLVNNQPGNGSLATDDRAGVKRTGATILSCEDDISKTIGTSIVTATAATILPRAVPQARKASLARFLEKRKERVSNTMPYSFDKTSENSTTPLVNAGTSDSSVPRGHRTINQDLSRFKGQANDCEDTGNFPSTNLEI